MPTAEREGVATHQFEPEAASVPEARRLACEFAGELMDDGQRSRLEVAVSEVVANAVRHSGSDEQIRLVLNHKNGYLCVRVVDGGSGLVPQPGAMSSEPGAGFGLFLVEQLTRRWGVTREDGRTRVWFEIDYADSDAPVLAVPDAPCDAL
ncbi:MAG TPA: ATP-binding protein [Thermoleophilaceae bacterium]|nr:ATP-binding protein [Thermoleophilaceae bacterium]